MPQTTDAILHECPFGPDETYQSGLSGLLLFQKLARAGNNAHGSAKGGSANAGEKKEFTFTYEGSDKDLLSYSFTFVNEPTTVEVSKTDITDGKELPGAYLRAIDENANVIDEWVSEEKPHIIRKLVVGREYELIETKPADGCATAESVSFKIENTGEVQKVKMEDDVTKVRLSKSDITTGKEVPGAKLTTLDEAGKVVESWTTAEEAHNPGQSDKSVYTDDQHRAAKGDADHAEDR